MKQPNSDKIISDEELREYVKDEFVCSGFIQVTQWKNFIDYLQILLKQERNKVITQTKAQFKKKVIEVIDDFDFKSFTITQLRKEVEKIE